MERAGQKRLQHQGLRLRPAKIHRALQLHRRLGVLSRRRRDSPRKRTGEDPRVEALAFDYLHFYGNANTIAWSPRWYRSEVRILRNTIPAWGPKGLFFVVLDSGLRGHYPRAAHTGATIYHYGWVRSEEQMNLKAAAVEKFWRNQAKAEADYSQIDAATLQPFTGTHPQAIQAWLPKAEGIFQADPNYRLSKRDKKHRLMLKLERWFGFRFNKKHYRLVR